MNKKEGYKDTLNLPKTAFSMKANLPQREPEILKKWTTEDIYKLLVDKRKSSEKSFILHDGPPYANGYIHLGHVLNKILKDICVKVYTMKGFYSPYVPGWDCHGLPVEHQLFKEMKITKHDIDQVKFRKKAHDYAMKFVKIQSGEFQRLGVFGDWGKPYLTLNKNYEADILLALADLCDKGFIYKDLKPVNWCKTCETALAEAEVEYEDKTSPSIFIKFRTEHDVDGKPASLVVWTTTPWTLLANVAVALHPDFEYVFCDTGDEILVLVKDQLEGILKKAGIEDYKIIRTGSGKELSCEIKKVKHPFIERGSKVVLADYVTKEEGTGCVHIAPGHGQDDFIVGKKYGLEVLMPVDDLGKFTKDAGEFSGMDIAEANPKIIDTMKNKGTLISVKEIQHSYPHCWRCKQPIIFRATEQWFMSIDHSGLRDKMSKEIDKNVEWIPGMGKDRIGSMVKTRPDWCLSRQRYWGVPIPAFKCTSCGKAFIDSGIVRSVAELVRKEGSNVWFEKDAESFLPSGTKCSSCGETGFVKEDNILDVWFDSGVSYKAVLEAREDLSFPADLYLEGSDQHRGWFQAALITSVATKEVPPYRKVLTHGFVVDGEGKKMSKSVGNVISPQEVMKKYGADILRLWVASSDYDGDIKLSPEILDRLADGYRKIRNTFRFLLSNLNDYSPEENEVDYKDLPEIDKWMLSRLYGLVEEADSCYEKWEFYKVYRSVYNFCVYEVSAFYLDVLKDVLYVSGKDSLRRRSSQTILFKILNTLIRIMAPILSFTTEEAYGFMELERKERSVHLEDWPSLEKEMQGWKNIKLDEKWAKILKIRDLVMKMLEVKREQGLIGSSLEAQLRLYAEDKDLGKFITENVEYFPLLFKVSQAQVAEKEDTNMDKIEGLPLKICITRADGQKCQRCWNYRETVGQNKEFPDLCERCYNVVSERRNNG